MPRAGNIDAERVLGIFAAQMYDLHCVASSFPLDFTTGRHCRL
jgi:hypothetical protein